MQPLHLCVGIIVGDNRYANDVEISVLDGNGRMRRLTMREPGIIAGSAGPYIIDLQAGEAFDAPPIDLARYWSFEPKVTIPRLPAGRYRLTATFKGGDPNKTFAIIPAQPTYHWPGTFWTGVVNSNPIHVTLTTTLDGHSN